MPALPFLNLTGERRCSSTLQSQDWFLGVTDCRVDIPWGWPKMLAAVRTHPGVANFIFCHLCCKSVVECLSLFPGSLVPLLPGFHSSSTDNCKHIFTVKLPFSVQHQADIMKYCLFHHVSLYRSKQLFNNTLWFWERATYSLTFQEVLLPTSVTHREVWVRPKKYIVNLSSSIFAAWC